MKVICIEELSGKTNTFKKGEIYTSNKINDKWWCIDAVGIDNDTFNKHFSNKINDIEEEENLKIVNEE